MNAKTVDLLKRCRPIVDSAIHNARWEFKYANTQITKDAWLKANASYLALLADIDAAIQEAEK